ncbi:MFS transporter [Actinokineospora auranticolor]|uniref:Putative MFS family arabinose efflux permease n=1 Tax=Actinokineospora auranticolor TaxID=155976 RepID=A0A2S6GG93_9PSEU|nr:MFS transporter [Actinokineospora auranticolor]PPK64237.1 putative MFS family arabinose efflux permease [Actinokineospora auranticolor]
MSIPVVAPPQRLWTSNFTLYFVARIVSMLGDAMVPVAMSVAVLGLGYGVSGVGFALGAWMGAFALFVVFGGVFADRFHPLPQMVGADAVRCGLQVGLAVYLWLGHPPLWVIIVGSVLGGIATAMFQPGLTSLVPQVAADPQHANGVLRVSQGVATMIGPALAGVLVASTSTAWAFAVDAVTFGVSGVCLLLLKVPRFEVDRTESTLANLRAGWYEFRSRSWLWSVILIWWLLGVLVWGPITPLGAASIIDAHGKAAFGWAEAAFGLGSVLGGLVAIRLRPSRPLFGGGIAMFLFPLMPLAAAAVPGVPLLILGYAISGAGWAFWGVQWATTVQTQIPEDKLNRVAAYEVAGSILAVPFGQAIAGPASALFGIHELLYVAAATAAVCAVALIATPPIRDLKRVTKV